MTSDIDIDFRDRREILNLIEHIPATRQDGFQMKRHPTGIHVQDIPIDPSTGESQYDFHKAEELGYYKLDLLNVAVYKHVKNPDHLDELLARPVNWDDLYQQELFENLIHVGGHWDLLVSLREKITNLSELAMFLALIRPGKRYLATKTWSEMKSEIWVRDGSSGYSFRSGHAHSYALLVLLHLQILLDSTQGAALAE